MLKNTDIKEYPRFADPKFQSKIIDKKIKNKIGGKTAPGIASLKIVW